MAVAPELAVAAGLEGVTLAGSVEGVAAEGAARVMEATLAMVLEARVEAQVAMAGTLAVPWAALKVEAGAKTARMIAGRWAKAQTGSARQAVLEVALDTGDSQVAPKEQALSAASVTTAMVMARRAVCAVLDKTAVRGARWEDSQVLGAMVVRLADVAGSTVLGMTAAE